MRNVELFGRTGLTVALRKSGQVAVMWNDTDEIEWLSKEDQDNATITPRH